MDVLICIDDTDNLDSIGTGKLLENLCGNMKEKGWIKESFISRHQLLIHESIDYTSHNSSMCCEIDVAHQKFDKVLEYSKDYLIENSAKGSDPGLCLIKLEDLSDIGKNEVISFGKKAKKVVINKLEAYSIAKKYSGSIFLSEHGGTGEGVIGALAGCGLRLYGSDGRVKGNCKLNEPGETISIEKFCEKLSIPFVINEEFKIIKNGSIKVTEDKIKKILWEHQTTVVLEADDEEIAQWKVISKNNLNTKKIGR